MAHRREGGYALARRLSTPWHGCLGTPWHGALAQSTGGLRHDPWTDHGADHPESVGLYRAPASTRGAWARPGTTEQSLSRKETWATHDQGGPEYQEHVAIDPVMVAVMERCGNKGARQLVVAFGQPIVDAKFSNSMYFNWGAQHSSIVGDGDELHLVLDQTSGSGVQSKKRFLFGSIEILMKLVPGNSAGTATAYYVSTDSSWSGP
ncbi:hypothetical protein Syun_012064 [Stephania yunnanensis]|uniref:GH16 domain-containing protein n=1 Tax=Stephania yunnanensis TaxID=152371 RepID=A0AAP0JZI7_9MAGN